MGIAPGRDTTVEQAIVGLADSLGRFDLVGGNLRRRAQADDVLAEMRTAAAAGDGDRLDALRSSNRHLLGKGEGDDITLAEPEQVEQEDPAERIGRLRSELADAEAAAGSSSGGSSTGGGKPAAAGSKGGK